MGWTSDVNLRKHLKVGTSVTTKIDDTYESGVIIDMGSFPEEEIGLITVELSNGSVIQLCPNPVDISAYTGKSGWVGCDEKD